MLWTCNYYHYFDEFNNFYCNETCPDEINKLIREKRKCVNRCNDDNIYKYEYKKIWYKECPNSTFKIEGKEDFICYDKIPESSYFDSNINSYNKCYNTYNKCVHEGNKTNHNCIECIDNYSYIITHWLFQIVKKLVISIIISMNQVNFIVMKFVQKNLIY